MSTTSYQRAKKRADDAERMLAKVRRGALVLAVEIRTLERLSGLRASGEAQREIRRLTDGAPRKGEQLQIGGAAA